MRYHTTNRSGGAQPHAQRKLLKTGWRKGPRFARRPERLSQANNDMIEVVCRGR